MQNNIELLIGHTASLELTCNLSQMCQSTIVLIYRKDNTCIVILLPYKFIKGICSRIYNGTHQWLIGIDLFFLSISDEAWIIHQLKLVTQLTSAYLIEFGLYIHHKGLGQFHTSLTVSFVKAIIYQHSQAESPQYMHIIQDSLILGGKRGLCKNCSSAKNL